MTREEVVRLCDPRKDDRYSRNLWLWLKSRRAQWCDAIGAFIPDTDQHALFLGHRPWDDGMVSGVRLNDILCNGSRVTWYAFSGSHTWTEDTSFWSRYLLLGKCVLDPHHYWYSERWIHRAGYLRTCRWCGRTDGLVQRQRVVVDERWKVMP